MITEQNGKIVSTIGDYMGKIAIATDSNSGITQEEASAMGIRVLPMPFYIDDALYYEGENLTRELFFEKLEEGAEVSTSQPSPADVMALWEELLESYDEVIYIPMSSGLSGSCATAMALAEDYSDRIHVIDNQRISVTQRQSVCAALYMSNKGMPSKEIIEYLMKDKLEASIYITVDTMKYLKKGGRITPAAAMVGTVLHIKPILTIQGEKLDAYAKGRGMKAAKISMLNALENDIRTRFAGKAIHLMAAYSCTEEEAELWKKQIEERFPGMEVQMNALPLSISCHTGAGAIAIGCAKKLKI